MDRVLVSELGNHIGNEVLLKGWVHQVRPLSKFAFLLLRDRTGIIQGIIFDEALRQNLPERETVVAVHGRVKAEKQAPKGYEVEVLADCVGSRTVENKSLGLEKMKQAGAQITGIEMALFELQRVAKGEAFKELSRLVK